MACPRARMSAKARMTMGCIMMALQDEEGLCDLKAKKRTSAFYTRPQGRRCVCENKRNTISCLAQI